MKDEAIQEATGRSKASWFDLIRRVGKADASHKEIADYLQSVCAVSPWWAQEITVEYEKHAGHRVLGQTQGGLFQLGVSRTIDAPAPAVWACLSSPRGIALITGAGDPGVGAPEESAAGRAAAPPPGLQSLEALDAETPSGLRVSTTTFAAGSHVRMRWRRPAWPGHSILQIRVTPKSEAKTVLSFHQEKLPSLEDRRELGEHWRRVAAAIAGDCQRSP